MLHPGSCEMTENWGQSTEVFLEAAIKLSLQEGNHVYTLALLQWAISYKCLSPLSSKALIARQQNDTLTTAQH